ncbi:MAG: 50S ribosomal protein L9 [Candidatus Puniceispirillum sp.]|nr:50S ribosomal protein L9 [Candidatus Pelagibacter sp.]MBA4283044.1 50S ribosomal protein L9 [Candidatus Puniceispirillum sp.]
MYIMQVVLLTRVEHLGHIGDIVDVKPGYARNFLLPQKKALRATSQNLEYFEKQRIEIEAHNLKMKSEAESVLARMDGLTVVVIRQASDAGQLFGSVRPLDIVAGVKDQGYSLDKNQVRITLPIKNLGKHSVNVVLHPEVIGNINVIVAQSEDEAAAFITPKESVEQD